MNIQKFLFILLIILITPAHAQETITEPQISEEQILLNGYVDTSGKVLLTGYATPESLSYMPFLNGSNYTFDNNTNQLYSITDVLTSKKADTWSFSFSLDGYYSDYSVTFYLPPGSEITRVDLRFAGQAYTLNVTGYDNQSLTGDVITLPTRGTTEMDFSPATVGHITLSISKYESDVISTGTLTMNGTDYKVLLTSPMRFKEW